MEEDRKGVWVEASKSTFCPKDIRRESRRGGLRLSAGHQGGFMFSLAPPAEEEKGGKVNEGEEGGPDHPKNVSFSFVYIFFSLLFLLSFLWCNCPFLGGLGMKEIGGHYYDGYSGLGQEKVYL